MQLEISPALYRAFVPKPRWGIVLIELSCVRIL